MVTLLHVVLRILGQILDHPRQQVHDAAEFFLSFNDAFRADAPPARQGYRGNSHIRALTLRPDA